MRRRLALDQGVVAGPQAQRVGPGIGRVLGVLLDREDMPQWREARAFEPDRARAGADVPDHRVGREAQLGERQRARFLLGDQPFLGGALEVLAILEAETRRPRLERAFVALEAFESFDQQHAGRGKIHGRGLGRGKVAEDRFVGQAQPAGDRDPGVVGVTGDDERPRNPRRAVLRAGKGEHPPLAGNGTQQRIKPVLGRGTDLPFAGILAVARGDRHVLPGLAPAGKRQLQRRRRRQHLDLRGFELAEQKAGDAVAERIASRQHGDRVAGRTRRGDPRRQLDERAVLGAQFGLRQLRAHQIERALRADHQRRPGEHAACRVGQSGPAVVENADNVDRSLHNTSSSSTRQMNCPSKSQTSTARR